MLESFVSLVAVLASSLVAAEPVQHAAVLTTGDLAGWPALFEDAPGVRRASFVPELDPRSAWPAGGDVLTTGPGPAASWQLASTPDGELALPAAAAEAVCWIALYVDVDAYGAVQLRAAGPADLRLFADGLELAHGDADVQATTTWRRGRHRLLLRTARAAGESGSASLSVEPLAGQDVATSVDPVHAVSEYDEWRALEALTGLALSPDGSLLALRRTVRDATGDGSATYLDVVQADAPGRVVAARLGGAGASAVAWSPDGQRLLVRHGDDLWTWARDTGRVEVVLRDEPGLGAVAWSPDGSFLVFASTRGSVTPQTKVRRRVDLRERLDDWPTRPHLHLLALESGARRRLAMPGDWAQDAFAVLADGRTLAYLRSVPIDVRPWFDTEVRTLDLVDGTDRLVRTLRMGFENRPGLIGFAASPDGRTLAFVGPPGELGDAAEREVNAFDPDLWIVDLETGDFVRASAGLDASVDGALTWTADGATLFFEGTSRSRSALFRLDAAADGAGGSLRRVPHRGDLIHALSHATRTPRVAYVSSSPDGFPALHVGSMEPDAEHATLLTPNDDLRSRVRLAKPVDASFEGPGGQRIDAWLYLPEAPEGARLPLVVYYYGGATPTQRGFDELHQFLVGNGYAVYVVNPRGAKGYGEDFANAHAGDWGPVAGEDVLAGVDDVLARLAPLDREAVGCYGGSYGGFMTMHLIARSSFFSAAVSLYGISNLTSYFGDGMWGWTYGDQAMAGSLPWRDRELFVERSPLFSADAIRTPLLLMHGDDDGNVPPAESEQMFTALRLLGRTVELVRFEGEDHGLRGTWSSRVRHRTLLLDWFDRFLRGRPEAWDAGW